MLKSVDSVFINVEYKVQGQNVTILEIQLAYQIKAPT
jgi:hypothetical protein